MLQTFRNAWRIEELRKKILFTLLIVLLYRLGNAVPVPFVDTKALADYFQASGLQNTIRLRVFFVFCFLLFFDPELVDIVA